MKRVSGYAARRVSGGWASTAWRSAVPYPLTCLPAYPRFWAALAIFVGTPAPIAAQNCVFQVDNVDRQGSVNETPSGTNYFAGGNVRLSCRGLQITMQSDSVAAYGGNVVH